MSEPYRDPFVLSVDVGSSSVKAALYDRRGVPLPGAEARRIHRIHSGPDGGAEDSPDHLIEVVEAVIGDVAQAAAERRVAIAGVGLSTLASTVIGLNGAGESVTPVYTYADSRPSRDARQLRVELGPDVYQRTGCPQHPAYFPSRLRWIRRTAPGMAERVRSWVDVGTLLYRRWFGRDEVPMSYSIASWMGMLDRHRLTWDEKLIEHLQLDRRSLPLLAPYSSAQFQLTGTYSRRWPALADARFFLAVGDGAAANVGSGCVTPERVALTIGTSGAMRILLADDPPQVPAGLWAYRLGAAHALLGGSISDGGSVFAWARERLQLPPATELEKRLAELPADSHGLTMLPFLNGERSPGWSLQATGALTGLNMATTTLQLLQASLEAVTYRLLAIASLLAPHCGGRSEIVASGGAITGSPYWLQMAADVLGRPVTVCEEAEASSRGAAILALNALGEWPRLDFVPPRLGETYRPDPHRMEIYGKAAERQHRLYDVLLGHDSELGASGEVWKLQPPT